jgi:hypothetical protein
MVRVRAFDMERGTPGNCAEFFRDGLAATRQASHGFPRLLAMAAANRWAPRSLIFRDLMFGLAVTFWILTFYRLALREAAVHLVLHRVTLAIRKGRVPPAFGNWTNKAQLVDSKQLSGE